MSPGTATVPSVETEQRGSLAPTQRTTDSQRAALQCPQHPGPPVCPSLHRRERGQRSLRPRYAKGRD